MKLKAVIFDLDGTLIDSIPAIIERHNLTAKKMGLPTVKREDYTKYNGLGWHTLIRGLWPDVDPNEFVRVYSTTPKPPYKAFPGALDAVKELRAKGFLLGVVTGKPDDKADQQLAAEGFELDWFEFVHGEGRVVACKPNGRAFDNALTVLGLHGVGKNDVVYIGDGLADLEAARNAGIKFIGVKTGTEELVDYEKECDCLLDTVADVAGVVTP